MNPLKKIESIKRGLIPLFGKNEPQPDWPEGKKPPPVQGKLSFPIPSMNDQHVHRGGYITDQTEFKESIHFRTVELLDALNIVFDDVSAAHSKNHFNL